MKKIRRKGNGEKGRVQLDADQLLHAARQLTGQLMGQEFERRLAWTEEESKPTDELARPSDKLIMPGK